jgi:hypothetical protein
MTSLLKILDEKIKQDKNPIPDFELVISWTPNGSAGDKIYNWALVKPNFPDSDSLEIKGHWQYTGKWHYDYPKNIMSLEDFFEGYFEDRETSTQIDNFFKSLKKSYIKTEVSDKPKHNSIFKLMNNFLVRYVNKFLIYTNKINDSTKLEDLYKLYMEYTDENMITYIKNYADKKLDFENIVNTSEEGFYIAKKKDSKEYVWTFITEEGELKVYETMHFGFHKIYEDHPYDEFFTLEDFFDTYIKGSIEIDEVEEYTFFESLSPETLKTRKLQHENIFTTFWTDAKDLFKNPESKPKRLFKLQELYYKFDEIKKLAELAELENNELNTGYLDFLKNKIGTDEADAKLFKECGEPELYINTTDNKLYLGYCGIFQGYYNSIDYPENFPEKSLELFKFDLDKHKEQLENIVIECRYRSSNDNWTKSGDWTHLYCSNVQDHLDTIRGKILEQILDFDKNGSNAMIIYSFLKNNFNLEGYQGYGTDYSKTIGEIMQNENLQNIHDFMKNMKLVWVENEIGALFSEKGEEPKFYSVKGMENAEWTLRSPWGPGETVQNYQVFAVNDLITPGKKREVIFKHRPDGVEKQSWCSNQLKTPIESFLKAGKNIDKKDAVEIYFVYEHQLILEMFSTHSTHFLDFFTFIIGENCDIFLNISEYCYNITQGGTEIINKTNIKKISIYSNDNIKKIIDNLIDTITYLGITTTQLEKKLPIPTMVKEKLYLVDNLDLEEIAVLIEDKKARQGPLLDYFLDKIENIYEKNIKKKIDDYIEKNEIKLSEFEHTSSTGKWLNKVYSKQNPEYSNEWEEDNENLENKQNEYNTYIEEKLKLEKLLSKIFRQSTLIDVMKNNLEEDTQKARTFKEELDKARQKHRDDELHVRKILQKVQVRQAVPVEDNVPKPDSNLVIIMCNLISNFQLLIEESGNQELSNILEQFKKINTQKDDYFTKKLNVDMFKQIITIYYEYITPPWGIWISEPENISFEELIKHLIKPNEKYKFQIPGLQPGTTVYFEGLTEELKFFNSPQNALVYENLINNIIKIENYLSKEEQQSYGIEKKYIEMLNKSILYIHLLNIIYHFVKTYGNYDLNLTVDPTLVLTQDQHKKILGDFLNQILEIENDGKTLSLTLQTIFNNVYKNGEKEIFEYVILQNYWNILEKLSEETINKGDCIEQIYNKYFTNSTYLLHYDEGFYKVFYEINNNEETYVDFKRTPYVSIDNLNFEKTDPAENYNIIKLKKIENGEPIVPYQAIYWKKHWGEEAWANEWALPRDWEDVGNKIKVPVKGPVYKLDEDDFIKIENNTFTGYVFKKDQPVTFADGTSEGSVDREKIIEMFNNEGDLGTSDKIKIKYEYEAITEYTLSENNTNLRKKCFPISTVPNAEQPYELAFALAFGNAST